MSAPPHLKPRYKFHKVCKIFGIHEDTLRSWMRNGVPLPGGRRTRIHFIARGLRGKEFECDEVERVYQEIRASGAEEADVLAFPNESDRDERRARRKPTKAPNQDDKDSD
jgi:DNA-binding transcriptional MerR regulator